MEERGLPWEALQVHMLKIHGKKDLKISGRKVQAFKGQELFPFCASICHPYQTSCLCRSAQISSSMQAAILTTSVPSQQAFLSRAAVLPPRHRKRMGVFTLISQKKNIFWLQRSCYYYFIGARRGGYIRMINGSGGKEERGGKSVSSRRAEDVILNVIFRQAVESWKHGNPFVYIYFIFSLPCPTCMLWHLCDLPYHATNATAWWQKI